MQTYFLRSVVSLVLIGLLFQGCANSDTELVPAQQTIQVGALLSLTGNWSSLGINSKAALEVATADINRYMEETGSRYRFSTTAYDTKLDTALAKRFSTEAKASGINFLIGPQSSAEAAAVKPFADANKVLVVSQGSTAGILSLANDNLFRFCPSDAIEGKALANTMYKAGVRGLVTVSRDDAGNKGLQLSTGTAFTGLGGAIAALAPYATTTTSFSSVLGELKSKIQRFTATYGAAKTAVYLASFDEAVDLFKQAASDPVLSSVNWYGGDGVALSAALVNDAGAASFAAKTRFFAPTFGLPMQAESKWQPLAKAIKDRTGMTPDAFALAAYDAMWVIALTHIAARDSNSDFEKLKALFPQQASLYYGVTGPTILNSFGDRAVGSFDYWGIVVENGTYGWKLTGKSD